MEKTGRTRSFRDSIHSVEAHGNVIVISYQPGNMTRYTLMINKFDDFLKGPLKEIGVYGAKYWAVSLLNNPDNAKTVVLRKSDEIGVWQVEALSKHEADRLVIAEFIGWLMRGAKEEGSEEEMALLQTFTQ